ncbi:MAG: hypothetical protein ABII89_04515 [Candidatus Omnitrophota bacterium]
MNKKRYYFILSLLFIIFLLFTPVVGKNFIKKACLRVAFGESLTDASVPELTKEFEEAYQRFLAANTKKDYTAVRGNLQKLANRETEKPEIRLYSGFLATLSSFIAGDITGAYQSGKVVLSLVKEVYPAREEIKKLEEVIKRIETGKISSAAEVKQELSGIGADEDILALAESTEAAAEMEKKTNKMIREGKLFKPLLDKELDRLKKNIQNLKTAVSKDPDYAEIMLPYIPELEKKYLKLKEAVDNIPSSSSLEEAAKKTFSLFADISTLADTYETVN